MWRTAAPADCLGPAARRRKSRSPRYPPQPRSAPAPAPAQDPVAAPSSVSSASLSSNHATQPGLRQEKHSPKRDRPAPRKAAAVTTDMSAESGTMLSNGLLNKAPMEASAYLLPPWIKRE